MKIIPPKQSRIALYTSLFCLGLINNSAVADVTDIERIIVTGSRSVESIEEVPSSVTLIDNKTLSRDMQISSELQNMLAFRVPGMAPSTGTSSNSGQTLRGRKALVMIDGVPQSTPLRNGQLGIRSIDPSAIERIEVIKGATSIYGNGASGGIINYITKRASSGDKANIELAASSKFSPVKFEDSAGYRYNASIDGTLDKVSYVLNGSVEETGLEYDAEGDIIGLIYGLSETKSQNLFTKLSYDFDGEKVLQLTYNYYEARQNADLLDVTGSVNSGVKTYAIKNSGGNKPGVPQGPSGNHNLMLKYTDEALFDNTQLILDAYYQEIENMFFYSAALANPSEGYDGGQSLIRSKKRGLRINFNTVVDWDNVSATFIYGIDALNDISAQPLHDGRIWVPEMDMSNLAGYLQTKWVIHDDWIVKAGLRHDRVDISVDDYTTLKLCSTPATCSVPFDVTGGELNFTSTTYNIGVRYSASEYISPFVSFSQGADISDLGSLLRTATVNDISLIQTQASIVDNYEVGFAGRYQDLGYQFAAYRSTSELGTSNKYDAQTGVYMPVRSPQKIWGYEAELSYQLLDNLDADLSYSWVEGKDTAKDSYLDGQVISAPKFTASLNWQPVDDANLAINYLYVGDRKRFDPIDGQYVGAQGPISAYNLINLSGSYQWEQWLFSLGVENSLNQDYYSARSQAYTYKGYNTKGLGTTVNVGVKVNF